MVVLVHFLRRSSYVPGQHFGNGLHHVAVMDRRLSHNYMQWSEKIEGQNCWLGKWNEVQSIWISFFWCGDLLRALLQLYHLSIYITILIQRFICQSQSWRQSQSQSSDEIDDKRIAAFSDCNASLEEYLYTQKSGQTSVGEHCVHCEHFSLHYHLWLLL